MKLINLKKPFILNILLVVIATIIMFIPLIVNKDAKFIALDDQAQTMISEIDQNYKPWFKPIWQPPNAEITTFLFALQSAIGAGLVGYFIGLKQKKKTD